ncbi:MAG: DEAD/DEAH box helicase [Deltaproteobacteria bacterium]|nr:DEAD/DEAH box helicase [Deltaproteobacteria bacterium]
MQFSTLPIAPPLLRAIAAKGYTDATPVQEAVLAPELTGRDLLVSSRTGSGKTVAFGFLLARALLPEGATSLPRAKMPSALVVAPTRELALQVASELNWLFAQAGGKLATCVGGVDIGRELRRLREGPHIVVGTPGRLIDHLERKSLDLSALHALVLDEADEMLDMGFREELEEILKDANKERQTHLFSATIPHEIAQLAKTYQRDAARVTATPTEAHQDIEVRAHLIAMREREHAVVNTLRASDAQSAIVFCATREKVNHLNANLLERGFRSVALSGELTQSERNRALQALRDGRANVLVATDVAARGLDLPDVGLVIQADLPTNAEVWQHRSGRTGRAGRKGTSVLLVPSTSRRGAENLLRIAKVKAQWAKVPGPEVIRQKDHERLKAGLAALLAEPAEEDLTLAKELLATHAPESLAAALVKLRREELPAPEELPLTAQVHESPSKSRPRIDTHPTRRPHETHPARRTPEAHGTPPHTAGRTITNEHAPRRDAHPRAQDGSSAPRRHTGDEKKLRDHGAFTNAVWFRVNIGRSKNADPRWLLPILCRRGGVGKDEIGKIQIMADETRFQIVTEAAPRFERSAKQPDKKDPNLFIQRVHGSHKG